jgi:glycosyltransferase involved in cell wall biosynthesis
MTSVVESSEPLVDVGIPTYRRPDLLREAIEGVLAQSLENWRLYVAEDGPRDPAVAEVLGRYGDDPRVRVLQSSGPELGPARNKNRLLETMTARYVAILDDDDRWEPGFLARRVEFLEDHPGCGFVFSGCREINSAGLEIGRYEPFASEGVKSSATMCGALLLENVVRTPTVLARREAFEAVGPEFDARFDFVYDWEMWFRLAVRSPAGYLLGLDADYRFHDDQATRSVRLGAQFLRLADHAQAMLQSASLDVDVDRRRLRAARSSWSISAALDGVERGERRDAVSRLAFAVRVRPLSLFDRRVFAAVLGLALGRRTGRALVTYLHERARRLRWRRMNTRQRQPGPPGGDAG